MNFHIHERHVNCTRVVAHFIVLLICTLIINIYAFIITHCSCIIICVIFLIIYSNLSSYLIHIYKLIGTKYNNR